MHMTAKENNIWTQDGTVTYSFQAKRMMVSPLALERQSETIQSKEAIIPAVSSFNHAYVYVCVSALECYSHVRMETMREHVKRAECDTRGMSSQ